MVANFSILGFKIHDVMYPFNTVDLFLDEISECLGKDAVLLTLTPKTIGGKNVKGLFSEYIPRKSRFVEMLFSCYMTCSTVAAMVN